MPIKDKNNAPTLMRELKRLASVKIQVGPIMDEDVKKYAAVHEFGYEDIPERSYLRSSFDDRKTMSRILRESLQSLNDLFSGEGTFEPIAYQIGQTMKHIIQEKIQSNIQPPLNPETIKRKGHSQTLLETGDLFQSIGARY